LSPIVNGRFLNLGNSVLIRMRSDMAISNIERGPLVHTFSILAHDPKTGDIGGAVQSHWFSVGTVVLWGEAGVGMIATQSFTNPAYGPEGLALLKEGHLPMEVVEMMTAEDEGRDMRQLSVMNARGEAATFTGGRCVPHAGHIVGDSYSVQANMMLNAEVVPDMSKAFLAGKGDLADRMMAALDAAQAAGGDFRGKQSAALLVLSGTPAGKVWKDRKIDIRVDDHNEPLKELRRLLRVHRAYELMNAADRDLEAGRIEESMTKYSAAERLFPGNVEMMFWHAATLAGMGRFDEAVPLFRKVFVKNPNWRRHSPDLVRLGILNISEEQLEDLLSL
jgi:uncharacterized Ntn-hydrolase superfamily protein